MTARAILARKGRQVATIHPDASVVGAAKLLAEKGVGSLVVVDKGGKMVGIMSERDIIRLLARTNGDVAGVTVSEVMSKEVIIALPDDHIDYLKGTITENRIRHLPVMDQGELVGIISIGDLVREEVTEFATENRYLHDYITGKYPG